MAQLGAGKALWDLGYSSIGILLEVAGFCMWGIAEYYQQTMIKPPRLVDIVRGLQMRDVVVILHQRVVAQNVHHVCEWAEDHWQAMGGEEDDLAWLFYDRELRLSQESVKVVVLDLSHGRPNLQINLQCVHRPLPCHRLPRG